jgi:hypothetical protein
MAERKGFEPLDPVKGQRFSRPPRSTTPAPLRTGIGILRFSSPFGKELFEKLATGRCCETAAVGERWSETAVIREVEDRSARTGFGIVGTPDCELQPRLPAGRDAHGTGFERDIEGAAVKPEVSNDLGRLTDGQDLGMCRGVAELSASVARAGDDLAITHDHRADGNLVPIPGCPRFVHGGVHEPAVIIVENPVRQHGFEHSIGVLRSVYNIGTISARHCSSP